MLNNYLHMFFLRRALAPDLGKIQPVWNSQSFDAWKFSRQSGLGFLPCQWEEMSSPKTGSSSCLLPWEVQEPAGNQYLSFKETLKFPLG